MVKSDVCGEHRPAPPSTGTTQADQRSAVVALWHSGQRYRFLDLGYRYLSAVANDPQISLEVLKALVAIGLGGPARELLQHRQDLDAAGMDIDQLHRSLVSVPTGRVPWEKLAAQFESNLAALRGDRPDLLGQEQEIRQSLRGLQLFRSSEGLWHLSQREPGQLRQWMPALTDSSEVPNMQIPLDAAGPSPVVIGIDLGLLVERVHSATQPDEGAAAIALFVVDDALYRFAAWLHVADRTPVLRDERVHFFVGGDALERYEQFLSSNEDIAIPGAHVEADWARSFGEEVRQIGQRVTTRRNEAFLGLTTTLDHQARQRHAATWAERLKPGARVLGFTSRFTTMLQYSMRDIGHALEELGYRFELIIEKADHRSSTTLTIAQAVYEADPALVVLINPFRYEQSEAWGAVPILTWIQDPADLVFSKKTGESLGELDFVCGYYRSRCIEEFGYPRSRFFSVILPVSTRMFHDGPVDPQDTARYECDLMYVGHRHADAAQHRRRWYSTMPGSAHPLLDKTYDEVTAMIARGEHLEEPRPLVDRLAGDLAVTLPGEALENIANLYAYRLFDILYRAQTLTWVARWAQRTNRVFKLYGRGWQSDPVFGQHAVGPIEHGEPLRRAYRCAKLVLQTLPGGFMHQRSFEGLASGSLVINRFAPQSFDHMSIEQFEQAPKESLQWSWAACIFPGLPKVVFRNAEELEHLCERLLADESYRHEVRTEMQEVVLRHFTYTRVLGGLLNEIRGELSAEPGRVQAAR